MPTEVIVGSSARRGFRSTTVPTPARSSTSSVAISKRKASIMKIATFSPVSVSGWTTCSKSVRCCSSGAGRKP